jgi:cellulose biosynthesis protein BcsQ
VSDPQESSRTTGKIVTFYSYKGGTGRSMALANIAWVLASNGLKVLVIDWDLEAPGLHRYFQPFLKDQSLKTSEGVIDFIVDFAAAAVCPMKESKESGTEWYNSYANLLRYATSLDWGGFPNPGTIDLVPAGRQDVGYAVRVNSFQWQHFYEKLGGGVFLEEVKRRIRNDYDYILIDSRTGVSDTSGICTVQMPDDLVVCFTLNQQSIEGASAAVASTCEQRRRPDGSSGLRVLPIVSRVDASEKEKLDLARRIAREYFDPFLEWLDDDQLEQYWGAAEIPYVPFYAYEEVLATFGDAPFQKGSVLSVMESLASWLTAGAVTSLGRFPDQSRLETLQQFVRQPKVPQVPVDTSVFYLSYAREDQSDEMMRFYQDLVNEVRALTGVSLEKVGYMDRTRLRPGDDFGIQITKAIAASQAAVCLLSPTYLRSGYCLGELDLFSNQGKPVVLVDWIPVLSDEVPNPLRQLNRFQSGRGLRQMLRVNRLNDQYQLELAEIAHRIVDLTDNKSEALVRGPLAEIPFVVVAERTDRIRTVRSNARPYGMRRRDWKPFWSMQGKSAGEIAREAARRTGANLLLTSLHKAGEMYIRNRSPRGGVIMLVDPWSLLISDHKEFLRKAMKSGKEVPVFSIICFDADGDTKQRRLELDSVTMSLRTDPLSPSPAVANNPEELNHMIDDACRQLTQPRSQLSEWRNLEPASGEGGDL